MSNDHEALQGFWKLVSSSFGGKPQKHPDLGTLFQFSGNRFLHLRSRVSYRFVIHPEASPKGIDLILPSTKGVAPGIYQLTGDRLQMMHATWRAARPVSFDDPKCSVEVYMRFKRRVAVKRRTKGQIPRTSFPGSLIPEGFLDD